MKRFVPACLALAIALAGCAQQKGRTADGAKVNDLENKFAMFQEEQRARDAEIDSRLKEIASRLDTLTTGKAPAPRGAKGKTPKQVASRSSRRPIVAGQVIPYSELVGNTAPARPASAPAPIQPAPAPSGKERAPQPLAAQRQTAAPVQAGTPQPMAGQAPQAASAPVNPDLVVTPPVVTLGPSYLNVPPAAQPRQAQPYTPAAKGRKAPAGHAAQASGKTGSPRAPQPVAEPAPAQEPQGIPAMPSMEPAAPPPAVPAPPQKKSEAAPAATPMAATSGAAASAPAGSVGMEEQRLYTEALRAVSSNKNDQGRKLFNDFISKYPSSAKTPEALYWIGESYMGDKSYNQAILSFKDLTTRFPKDDKSAVAAYRTAEAYELMGDKSNAAFNLKMLLQQYPNSEFAGKARQKLKQLGQ